MGANFISSTDFSSSHIIEFSIGSAKDGKNKDLAKIYNSLSLLEETSFGAIYLQQGNNELWFIKFGSSLVRFITQEQLDLFRNWDKKELSVSEETFKILSSIGGLPSHQNSFYPKNVEFPAAVKTKKGEIIDLCIIYFSLVPPIPTKSRRVIFIDEVEEIMPSSLALTHQLRLKSMLVEEIRMGFYPFTVTTLSGKLLTYNGITQFASSGYIKGNEVIDDVEFSFAGFDSVVDVPDNEITIVIGKWDERFEVLYDTYIAYIESETPPPIQYSAKAKSWWQRFFS